MYFSFNKYVSQKNFFVKIIKYIILKYIFYSYINKRKHMYVKTLKKKKKSIIISFYIKNYIIRKIEVYNYF